MKIAEQIIKAIAGFFRAKVSRYKNAVGNIIDGDKAGGITSIVLSGSQDVVTVIAILWVLSFIL